MEASLGPHRAASSRLHTKCIVLAVPTKVLPMRQARPSSGFICYVELPFAHICVQWALRSRVDVGNTALVFVALLYENDRYNAVIAACSGFHGSHQTACQLPLPEPH